MPSIRPPPRNCSTITAGRRQQAERLRAPVVGGKAPRMAPSTSNKALTGHTQRGGSIEVHCSKELAVYLFWREAWRARSIVGRAACGFGHPPLARLQQARGSTPTIMAAAGAAEELGLALCEASEAGNMTEVARLLDGGADVEAKDNVSRPLPSCPNLPGPIARLGRAHCHSAGPQPRRGAMAAGRGRAAAGPGASVGRESCGGCVGVGRVSMCCRLVGRAGRSSIPVCRPV